MPIVDVGGERRLAGEPILDSVVDATSIQFQPSVLTPPAFITGMVPPELSIGAGATGGDPRGLCVVSEVIASATPAVRFVLAA